MTVTIELPSDIAADLVAQARAHGLDLPQYVEHLLREHVPLRDLLFRRLSRLPRGASPGAAFLTRHHLPMTILRPAGATGR